MWKEHDVVMLSTEKASNALLLLNLRGGKNLEYHANQYFTQEYLQTIGLSSYALYVLSDEKIEKGDWRINYLEHNCITPIGVSQEGSGKKIIATTDKSLLLPIPEELMEYPHSYTQKSLPQLPQSFITHYINEYNKGNVITKVMVEYDEELTIDGNADTYAELHINSDNTINIKSAKDSWSKEEMELSFNAGRSYGYTECAKGYGVDFPESSKPQLFDKWIEQNL
jgi:hypothetical protein